MNVATMPTIFQVEITSVCNMKCNFCPHPTLMRPKKHMDYDVFVQASKYFVAGQRIGLYMMGDPLLCPDLLDYIRIAHAKGCKPEIATNSLAFNKTEFRRRVLKSGLSYIILDMTFSKEDSILMLRAVENIRLLIEDYRSLMKEHPHHDKLLPQLAFQIVNTRSADVQDFPQYVKDFVKEFPGKGLLKRKFLDSWAGQHLAGYDIFAQPVPEVRTPCAEPFNRVAVLVNGDVVPCCRDARGKYIYGNLTNERLDQIWNSERVVKLRQLMIDSLHDQLPEPCRTCREWHIPMDRHIATVDGSDEGVSNA